MDRLPPLASLLAFEAVVETGSVTAAAIRLGRTHGAVSKQIHQLQAHAGVELFSKRGTGIVLTLEGRKFGRTVAQAFADLREGYRHLAGSDAARPVTIAVSASFARVWAIPTISRFNKDHPDIDVLIRLIGPRGSRELDPPPDLVMSWDRLLAPRRVDPYAISLGDVHMGPVVAPGHRFTFDGKMLSCGTRIDRREAEIVWDNWQKMSGIRLRAEKEIAYEHFYLAFEAARLGMGVAIAPRFLIEEELASGALLAPAGFLTFRDGFYVRPHEHLQDRLPRNAAVFLEWLKLHARTGA
ncbi:LysR family transcriptional regulator [Rhizobium halophytocola]|uniref:DNA-binding transcriptional LysR family regulator n=1 Tax=Rhizobium halophytocola TaxID=735519 RepID=A0ABS4DX48_9HYPH|nr:LysR family transcriptional regulator [Rhizobium halophytocola]MBP1850268.1 DNA-binding transcriptional LysR family regulator [Rhizobium halophytocola]